MAVPVDIYVWDNAVVPAPIQDVVVFVLSGDGTEYITQQTTDASGKAALVLDGNVYEVRFYKRGWSCPRYLMMTVLEPATEPNTFDVTMSPFTHGTPADSRVCRCTGRFVGVDNKPLAGVTVRVMAKADIPSPKVLDGNMVVATTFEGKTDSEGFISIDLVRGGEFYVTFGGEDDTVWNICIPDRSQVNLIDLIHPYPVALEWDSPSASVVVVESVEVGFEVVYSDFTRKTKGFEEWLQFTNSDGAVASLEVSTSDTAAKATLRGINPGTSQVTVTLLASKLSPQRTPIPSLSALPLYVTVAP